MTTLPEPLHPGNRNGSASKSSHSIDWKSAKLIHALLCGIDAPIEDNVVGVIPANVPLRLEQAARAVNMRLKRARALRMTPEFCEAMRQATAAYRACLEPGNIATALEIRDDKLVKPKERLKAAEFLQGPKPGSAGVVVNVSQNAISPGYIIKLTDPEPAKTIDHEAAVIPASAHGTTAGDIARDAAAERRSNAAEDYAAVTPAQRCPSGL